MMCACEQEFAQQFLPHQLSSANELSTGRRIQVTLNFQKGICNTCRGISEEAHPKAALYGRTSKILRYYWREIHFETIRRFAEWAKTQKYKDWLKARLENKEKYGRIEKDVISEFKRLHAKSPKYVYHEESQDEIVAKYQVEKIKFDGVYIKQPERGIAILEDGKFFSAEKFAAYKFEQLGYRIIFAESVPFHALFGIFTWLLIQDHSDPNVRMVGFGDRFAFEQKTKGEQIWTFLPEDFGKSGYASRRAKAIDEHFTSLLNFENKDDLLWSFDYWIEPSADLRQYLWAHRDEDVAKAREIASVLPINITLRILRYLVGNYWGRYLGWPDLIVYDDSRFFFAEIKS
ncbi:hypothetical protein KA005_34760, partial [bacterium]|nr:hypothetical protein [bacterium]